MSAMLKRNMQSTLNAQQLIEAAYISNASDIHIEPRQQHYDTKIRQQGEIQHQGCISFKTGKQIINQICFLSHD